MPLIRRLLALFQRHAQTYEKELLSFFPPPHIVQSIPDREEPVNLKPYSYLWFASELFFWLYTASQTNNTRIEIGRMLYRAYECLDDNQMDHLIKHLRLTPSQTMRYCHGLVLACKEKLAKQSEPAE